MRNQTVPDKTQQSFLEAARPKLEVLENIRLGKLKIFNWRKKIAAPIAFVMTPILGFVDYWLFLLQRNNEDMAIGVSAIGLGTLWGWVTQPKREYNKAYKTKILPDIASLFGQFTYDMKGKIPMDLMKPSKIVPRHRTYRSEDFFSGNYHGVDISFSEIKLTKKSGKQIVTVFNGLAILLTNGTRKFHGHTVLTKDQGKISKWFKKSTSDLKRANMVDLEFERLFDVYTNDQTEARYLIDPAIIENLKTLYNTYEGKQMRVAFYNQNVLILIESQKNHFEPAAIKVPATNETELLAMKQEVTQILAIVDSLSLYDPLTRREALAKNKTVAE